uniref:Cytochrome b5-related protein n=1 Tax=Photinus pyralis TaxID=7054 RepID=A0A1Y1KP17_PHOPY
MSLATEVQLSLSVKYPTNLVGLITGDKWLNSKRESDGAEGLWRIHDGLYDVSDFISSHPGGPSWLEMTKGTDITEAFEAHHVNLVAEKTLQKYYVRKALAPRNSPFTFEEDGFYRTLKRNIRPILKTVPKSTIRATDLVIDALVVGTFLTAICAAKFMSLAFACVCAFLLTFTTIAAHNYFHKRDNFRMYYFNLCLMDFRGWRISHALSHHLFPNTIYDLEMITWETLVPYFPVKKSFAFKCKACVTAVILWVTVYFISYAFKVYTIIKTQKMYLSDLIPFTLPLAMYLINTANPLAAVKMWLLIVTVASFIFGVIGFSAAHHHPDAFHEGDAPRAKKLDWAIHQLDTTYDRYKVTGNSFLVLTTFGDHALHHIFPTLDHGALKYLYPVFEKTMKEFGLGHQMRSQTEMFIGQFRQLARDTPHVLPAGSRN